MHVMSVAGYQTSRALGMTATWSRQESGTVDELLRQYWTDVIISRLSSYESLSGVALKGDPQH